MPDAATGRRPERQRASVAGERSTTTARPAPGSPTRPRLGVAAGGRRKQKVAEPPPRQALILFNPAAGRQPRLRARQVRILAAALRAGGWTVAIEPTAAQGDAGLKTRRAAERGCDVVVGCGGDGTLQQIAQALLESQDAVGRVPLLAVAPPWGTANTFACTLGCPNRPRRAAQWLLRAQPQAMPVGELVNAAGQRMYFLSIGSAGYDAAIVHSVRGETKKRWGKLAFAAAALTRWRRYFPAPMTLAIGGATTAADGVLLGLTRFYGGRLRLGRPEPGGPIALALRGAPFLLPMQGLALLTLGLEHAPGVERLGAGVIAIATPGIPLEADGEPAGFTPARLALSSRTLHVLRA
jgi:diacylglycerol kinase (ATP)